MPCPPEIAEVLARITTYGILNARAAAWGGDAECAAIEADHVHNLPSLLVNYDAGCLDYYWEAERPCYLQGCARRQRSVAVFEPLWQQLRQHMDALAITK